MFEMVKQSEHGKNEVWCWFHLQKEIWINCKSIMNNVVLFFFLMKHSTEKHIKWGSRQKPTCHLVKDHGVVYHLNLLLKCTWGQLLDPLLISSCSDPHVGEFVCGWYNVTMLLTTQRKQPYTDPLAHMDYYSHSHFSINSLFPQLRSGSPRQFLVEAFSKAPNSQHLYVIHAPFLWIWFGFQSNLWFMAFGSHKS